MDFEHSCKWKRYYDAAGSVLQIRSTAGAVPVKNAKGELTMEKVKVTRYITGKKPIYACKNSDSGSSDSESDDEKRVFDGFRRSYPSSQEAIVEECYKEHELTELEKSDPRFRRLTAVQISSHQRFRSSDDAGVGQKRIIESSESEVASDFDDDEKEVDLMERDRHRNCVREKLTKIRKHEKELMEKKSDSEIDSSDNDELTEVSEDEFEMETRRKPVFVRKEDRNLIETESEESKKEKAKEKLNERRKETLKQVEEAIVLSKTVSRKIQDDTEAQNGFQLEDVNTDDDDDAEQTEYRAWKTRELTRAKRDLEERNAFQEEQQQVERLHKMNDEERRWDLKVNPKVITNKYCKGRMKYLQKYYHRGSFYLDKEEKVLQRDVGQPTLDDHVDKTVLPTVMQVKNFGKSGRSKYTHLTNEDTSAESPWEVPTLKNLQFQVTQAAGARQIFENPSRTRLKENKRPGKS